MATNALLRQVQLQDALLKIDAGKSLRCYVEQAWPLPTHRSTIAGRSS